MIANIGFILLGFAAGGIFCGAAVFAILASAKPRLPW